MTSKDSAFAPATDKETAQPNFYLSDGVLRYSDGNFPDTTNGDLSMEKTIEGQQPRDDGGGGGEGVGEGVGTRVGVAVGGIGVGYGV